MSEIRFGISDGRVRSLTFKLWKHGSELYLASREFSGHKLSLHKSGINRYASQTSDARRPIMSTTQLDLVEGRFSTVARILFKSETNWEFQDSGKIPKGKFLRLPCFSPNYYGIVSIGATPHHPNENKHTASSRHLYTLKVRDRVYYTITLEIIDLDVMKNIAYNYMAYHPRYDTISLLNETRLSVNELRIFRTNLNTYTFFAIHRQKASPWVNDPIIETMEYARKDLLSGIYEGQTLESHLDRTTPDWREQLNRIRGIKP